MVMSSYATSQVARMLELDHDDLMALLRDNEIPVRHTESGKRISVHVFPAVQAIAKGEPACRTCWNSGRNRHGGVCTDCYGDPAVAATKGSP